MEYGFRPDVVSRWGRSASCRLLPALEVGQQVPLGTTTPRTYDGNIRAGVRYSLVARPFQGDRRLALTGYYQGAQAVRDRGLFDDTKRYVAVILKLHGSV